MSDLAADATLTAQVRDALMAEPALRGGNIHIHAVRGLVQLSGVLDSGELLHKAITVAQGVPGVSAVRHHLTIRNALRLA